MRFHVKAKLGPWRFTLFKAELKIKHFMEEEDDDDEHEKTQGKGEKQIPG